MCLAFLLRYCVSVPVSFLFFPSSSLCLLHATPETTHQSFPIHNCWHFACFFCWNSNYAIFWWKCSKLTNTNFLCVNTQLNSGFRLNAIVLVYEFIFQYISLLFHNCLICHARNINLDIKLCIHYQRKTCTFILKRRLLYNKIERKRI